MPEQQPPDIGALMSQSGQTEVNALLAGLPQSERDRVYKDYPLPQEDLLVEIREAKTTDELVSAVERIWSIREGLVWGPDYYDLDDPEQLVFFANLFTSIESGTDRITLYYPEAEIENRVQGRVRKIKSENRKKETKSASEFSEEEKKEISKLIGIENISNARKLIDIAYVQRMLACEQAEAVAQLLSKAPDYRSSVKPDKGHWLSFFSGEFGARVNNSLEQIIAFSLPRNERQIAVNARIGRLQKVLTPLVAAKEITPAQANTQIAKYKEELEIRFLLREAPNFDFVPKQNVRSVDGKELDLGNIYVSGLNRDTGGDFKKWLTALLKTAHGDMAAVWAAWRLALVWELPAQFGRVMIWDENKKRWNYKIVETPIGSDYFAWAVDIMPKRMIEWGFDVEGKRVRTSKYLSHTGYPLSIRHIRKICQGFLHSSEIETKRKGKKTSLWEKWWVEGVGFHEAEFPWASTDAASPGADPGEMPPASFGFWYLTRMRAHTVIEDIRSRPSLRDISDPDYWAKRARMWDKVLRPVDDYNPENPLTYPDNNPRYWWVAGILMAHHLEKSEKIPLVEGEVGELDYRTYDRNECLTAEIKGGYENKGVSVSEVLNHAYQSGFLRKVDIDWLIRDLKLPKPIGAGAF